MGPIVKLQKSALLQSIALLKILSLCNRAVQIPEVFPALGAFPEEYLPLDQTAVAVHSFHNLHLFLRQRILHRAAQVAYIIVLINGERNRNLPSLNRPFQTDYRRVDVVAFAISTTSST